MSVRIVARPDRDQLGEGPIWDARREALLWVDIVGQRVHRMPIDHGAISTLSVDEPIGWVLPRRDAPTHVAGFRSGFHFLDLDTGHREPIGDPEPDRPANRLNDAKVDPAGRIWAGSKNDEGPAATGALYRLDPSLAWDRCDDGYGVANGPTFSLDGRTLYHTDSAERAIYAFDCAEDATLGRKRLWRRFEDEDWGFPDGMTTDADDCLWVAHWGGGRVSRFAPDGELLRSISLPAVNITSCAFAGRDLDRLFVTSAAIESDGEPYAGALFEVEVGICGAPVHRFAG